MYLVHVKVRDDNQAYENLTTLRHLWISPSIETGRRNTLPSNALHERSHNWAPAKFPTSKGSANADADIDGQTYNGNLFDEDDRRTLGDRVVQSSSCMHWRSTAVSKALLVAFHCSCFAYLSTSASSQISRNSGICKPFILQKRTSLNTKAVLNNLLPSLYFLLSVIDTIATSYRYSPIILSHMRLMNIVDVGADVNHVPRTFDLRHLPEIIRATCTEILQHNWGKYWSWTSSHRRRRGIMRLLCLSVLCVSSPYGEGETRTSIKERPSSSLDERTGDAELRLSADRALFSRLSLLVQPTSDSDDDYLR